MLATMASAMAVCGVSANAGNVPRHKHQPKPHWKKVQTDSERGEKLRKAEEKRQRKAIKKYGVAGEYENEVCNRNGCKGIISKVDEGSCCCHCGNPPCGHCTDMRVYCDECDWESEDVYV